MESRSIINKSSIISTRSSTRSQLKANKARQAELKALYHSSFSSASTNKNDKSTLDNNDSSDIKAEETREPIESSPPRVKRSSSESTSMSPIKVMTDSSPSQDELNNVTPDKRHDSPETTEAQTTSVDDDANVDVNATQQEAQEVETPEERAKRRAAHPMKDIAEPLPTDCLFGRGGGTNHHPGNKLYRKMVEDKKDVYLKSKRLDKPLVAMQIIKEWRELDPPGRFLKQDEVTKLWSDVGDKKAREKTSQALREKTGKGSEMDDYEKETRFESGTKMVPRGNLVTRDHSLGTEVIEGEEYYSMEGFSWDELDNREAQDPPPSSTAAYPYVRENSLVQNPLPGADVNHPAHNSFGGYPPPPTPHHHHYGHPPPPPPPHHPSSHHPSHRYPPQHDYHHRPSPSGQTHHDRGRNHSLSMNPLPGASTSNPATNSFDDDRGRPSWGSYSSYDSRAPPPLPPSYYGYGHPPPPPPPAWGSPPSHYHPHGSPPLSHYGRPAPQSAFAPYDGRVQYYDEMAGSPQDFTKIASLMGEEEDEIKRDDEKMSRSGSNSTNSIERSSSWGGYERKNSLVARETSIGSFAPYDVLNGEDNGDTLDDTLIQRSKSMPHPKPYDNNIFPSPPLPIQNRKKPEIVEKKASPVEQDAEKPSLLRKISGGGMHPPPPPAPRDGVYRPEPVKRDTSNQPESPETKRSTKRVVLSRDASAISRTLKEEQLKKAVSSKLSKAELIDRNLSIEINKLGLGDRPTSLGRMTTDQLLNSLLDDDIQNSLLDPQPLTLDDRVPTIDAIAMGIASGQRTQSCDMDDALGLIMDDTDDAVVADAPSAVNEDIAAKWIRGESFAEEDAI
ncbi:hypothetical protein HJC23_008518 [Cyclotella cryptica]|uniref:DUF6824 domain-containing protein n=1 Tax=Cyclotella cryptica TaxID=29204 RepID=A0ABD3QWW4_9STRA|eukprot:CCRYP_001273-RA/>CCRYP_001273-RA protein AED:0.01 eAED:-0.00 QI:0/-1/0/1/-1/1/1/0/842